MKSLMITGASGFLGRSVIARIAPTDDYQRIYILIRETAKKSADERVDELVKKLFPPEKFAEIRGKMIAVAGDLTKKDLGMSHKNYKAIVNNVDQILHVGASTDFGAPIEESRLYNVEGTRIVMELAKQCRKDKVRVDYVSTAYVAGIKGGRVTEDDLTRGQDFANNYERSKYEAEVLVRSYMNDLDVCIQRPSIVVGDSRNGFTPHFKVLYWPLKLLSKNILSFLPVNRWAKLDVVPVDYVADSMVVLMKTDACVGQTYHITTGYGHEVTVNQLIKDAQKHVGIERKPIIPVWVFEFVKRTPLRKILREEFWDAVEIASPYTCYVSGTDVRFDCSKTRLLLEKHGVKHPSWPDYCRNVLEFCISSRWGRKLAAPEYSYY